MNFEALDKYDSENPNLLLAKLAKFLLPNPELTAEQDLETQKQVYNFFNNSGIEVSSLDNATRAKLLDEITDELLQRMLPQGAKNGPLSRLGDKGFLRLEQYQITFGGDFQQFEELAIRKNHVRDAIHQADVHRHYLVERFRDMPFSLFYKVINNKARDEPFALLVLADRKGNNLQVNTALRIYSSDIEVSLYDETVYNEPISILERFILKYGLAFTVGRTSTRFIFYDVLPLNSVIPVWAMNSPELKKHPYKSSFGFHNMLTGEFAPLFTIDDAGTESLRFKFSYKINTELNAIRVSNAFVIDLTRYKQDLKRRGVHVS